jgi:transcriptional regulator with XRE-family HTH domain
MDRPRELELGPPQLGQTRAEPLSRCASRHEAELLPNSNVLSTMNAAPVSSAAKLPRVQEVAPWQHSAMAQVQTMADRLCLAMDEKKMNGAELSRRSGVGTSQITRTRDGQQKAPAASIVMSMARALGVEPAWLIDGEGPMWSVATPGRKALDETLETMVWPEPVDVRACDAVVAQAQREAETVARDRPKSVWVPRLRELYREAVTMPAGVEEPSGLGAPKPAMVSKRATEKRR